MTHSSSRAMATLARGALLALLLALGACGGDAAAPAPETGIARETFIATYVDLRAATIRAHTVEIPDQDRAEILARHGVTEDDLLAFAEAHGEDVAYMRRVWDEVEARMDAARVDPGPGDSQS